MTQSVIKENKEVLSILTGNYCQNSFQIIAKRSSLVAQTVKNPPAIQGTQVRSQGQEDSLEKTMATHTSIFAWRIPWSEEHGGLQSMGSQRVGHDWMTNTLSFSRKSSLQGKIALFFTLIYHQVSSSRIYHLFLLIRFKYELYFLIHLSKMNYKMPYKCQPQCWR